MRIALVGDFNPDVIAHQAIPKALALAADGAEVQPEWLDAESALHADLDRTPDSGVFPLVPTARWKVRCG